MFNIISTAFLATLAVGTRDMFQKKKKNTGKEGKKKGERKKAGRKKKGFSRSWGFREN